MEGREGEAGGWEGRGETESVAEEKVGVVGREEGEEAMAPRPEGGKESEEVELRGEEAASSARRVRDLFQAEMKSSPPLARASQSISLGLRLVVLLITLSLAASLESKEEAAVEGRREEEVEGGREGARRVVEAEAGVADSASIPSNIARRSGRWV